ncbi:glycoside hydrolase N-terminal domain-containing protein [Bacteroidota bacterium]
MRSIILLSLVLLFSCQREITEKQSAFRLWYDSPAQTWTEALPLGNGRLGAMVFGDVSEERIQFNDETLWNGKPRSYAHTDASLYLSYIRKLIAEGRQKEAEDLAMVNFMSEPLRQEAYQPFGDLILNFPDQENHTNYLRILNLVDALSVVTYEVNGVNFRRETFVSEPDQVIVVRLTSSKSEALNFSIILDSPHTSRSVSFPDDLMTLDVMVEDGALRGYAGLIVRTNGEIAVVENQYTVSEASEATIILAAATNYIKYNDISGEPEKKVVEVLSNIEEKSFEHIKKDHIRNYQSLFNRFSLSFSTDYPDTIPTDERINNFWKDPDDPQLLALYVQYARYLMISSSRPGTQPANLQGIWNDRLKPPWDSKWTVNINTEMNYWPAEVMNLSECHEPLFGMIKDCSETGSITAKEHYNCEGWVLHHNTDIWRGTAPINASNHGIWVTGGAWLCQHLWEHYQYTQDEVFLREEAYPLMREAAIFFTEFLIEDPETRWLISTPSSSPENGGLVAGPTMDHQIIRTLFNNCIEASEILGSDKEFAELLKETVLKIAPNQIGRLGQLQEWMTDIDNPDNHHRHVSHLWGVHPGNEINWEYTPDLMEAAKQSLIFRGDEGTGWSLAWKINFWARFLDGNHAYKLIHMLLSPAEEPERDVRGGSYPNLFDAHPPFQIDGNFGGGAGIVELLVQSHLDYIDILPALPDALPEGFIQGVCTRGGFELSLDWENGKLNSIEVLSKAGKKCKLRYNDKTIEFETELGVSYNLDSNLTML